MRRTIYSKHTEAVQGIGLVEAVVVVSIASVAFVALLASAIFFLRAGLLSAERAQALYILEESVESVRFLRDQGYTTNITPLVGAGVRYIEPSPGGMSATTTNTSIFGKFTRTIELRSVHRRNSDDDIIPSTSGEAKTLDPGTAELIVEVTWAGGRVDTTTYVANIYDN